MQIDTEIKSLVDMHMPTGFLALSAESLEERKTAMSTASMEILISKYEPLIKQTRISQRRGWLQGCVRKMQHEPGISCGTRNEGTAQNIMGVCQENTSLKELLKAKAGIM